MAPAVKDTKEQQGCSEDRGRLSSGEVPHLGAQQANLISLGRMAEKQQ